MDVDWIREQLRTHQMSQADLGELIGLTSVQVNKVLTGYRRLYADEADRIREAFGYTLPERPRPTVAVAGRVGAGARIPLVDDYEKGDGLYHVLRPAVLPGSKSVVAVEVSGLSMAPVYATGDLLFYHRDGITVAQEAIGHNAICCDEHDDVWVKHLRTGTQPGLFNLISLNPTADNQHDVRLKWACRVLLHLPADLVERA